MGIKKMVALLAVGFVAVAALAVYVIFYESAAPTTDEAAKDRGLVFRYKDDKSRTLRDVATKLEIARGKDAVAIEKADAQNWRLKKPVDARADRSAVLAILDGLKNLTIESVVQPESDTPEELAKFGLKEPRLRATFWLGDKAQEFAVGSELKGQTASEKRAYVRLKDEKRILVVANDLIEKLDKKPDAFRDKKVFDRDRDPEKATALKVVTPARTLEIAKGEKLWSLKAPVSDAADASKVSGLLSKARNLDVEKFVTEDAAKAAEYGLDKPQLTCEVKADDGSTMKVLIGKDATEKDHLYAKRGEEPAIFTVKKDFLTEMDVKLDDVRDRKVASFDDADVTGIEVAAGKAAWSLARESKEKDWKLTKPREANAYQSSVGDFLKHLGHLRVVRWVDDPKDPAQEQMKQPEATVTLSRETKGKAQPPLKLAFSAVVKTEKPKAKEEPKEPAKKEEKEKEPAKQVEEGRYVRREGQPGLLYVVAGKAPDGAPMDEKDSIEALTSIGESLGKGYLAFLDRRVFDFKEDGVVRLAIERDATKLALEKKDGNWKLTSPAQLDADKNNVSTLVSVMKDLLADELVAESPKPDDLKRYGLDAPALRLTATIEEAVGGASLPRDEKKDEAKADEKKKEATKEAKKTTTKTLLLSRKLEGKTYGMEQGGTLVFTIKSWDADSLRTEVISTTLGDFAEADATSLTIAPRGKPEVVVEKEKDVWAISKPKKAEADQDAVKKVLDALHDLKGHHCLDYEAKGLAAFGLDPAEVVVTVKVKDKPDLILKLGKPVAEEKENPGSAAVKGDGKQVFLVVKNKIDDIAKTLADLEKKPEPKAEAPKKEEPKAPDKKEPEKKADGK